MMGKDKTTDLCLIFLIVISFFLLSLHINPAQRQQKLQEEVTVTAVEVSVRVLLKGRVVKGLTKDDFEIYENGIRQEITAFEVHSRKIAISKGVSSEELKIPPAKRLFILIFNVFDYQKNVGEAIDYFFKNFFRQSDRLIILFKRRGENCENKVNRYCVP